jgi:hypothetical protein
MLVQPENRPRGLEEQYKVTAQSTKPKASIHEQFLAGAIEWQVSHDVKK